ncbi:hypothetical protein DRV85_15710 [Rhodosalinus halophilus]|uniref:Uncharacterized protein n=1 Tax=Rhodosalinus halophilus TaxID=2259333 RepID=A0A365U593_9RHOB|nr:hypothetical protein DRV85_15710 [Rhodosalinus halophilus]
MTINTDDAEIQMQRAAGDVDAERICLRCRSPFRSEGFGERICSRCKGSAVWRAAIHEGYGQGRRRSGGRMS